MKFNEKIVVLRKIKKITQDELACAVGVSRQAVYKWECGQSYPEVAKLIELKLLFNISIDDLLDDSFEIALPEKKRRKRIPKAEKQSIENEVRASMEPAAPAAEPVVAKEPAVAVAPKAEVKAAPAPKAEPKVEVKAQAPAPKAEPAPAPEVKPEPAAPAVEPAVAEVKEEAAAAENADEKKKGFFGRLFGKK
jgi:transcriptional regulator with XRE-family HTH domain